MRCDGRHLLLATLGVVKAGIITWCPQDGDTIPPALSVPMELLDAQGGKRQVALEVARGADIDETVDAFAASWQLGDLQQAELRRAVHNQALSTGTVVSHVLSIVIVSHRQLPAVVVDAAPNATVVLVHEDILQADACEVASKSGALAAGTTSLKTAPLGSIIEAALNSVEPGGEVIVTLSTTTSSTASVVGMSQVVREHVRLKYAHGMLGEERKKIRENGYASPLVLAVPSPAFPHEDEILVFDAAAFRAWWTQLPRIEVLSWARRHHYDGLASTCGFDALLFVDRASQHRAVYRGWWLVADSIIGNSSNEVRAMHDIPELDCASQKMCPPFAVVTIEQGDSDTSTSGAFADISASVVSGLRALGLAVRAASCTTLGGPCTFPRTSDEQLIVLGAHNLQVFVDGMSGAPLMLGSLGPSLIDKRAVLYNFEYVPSNQTILDGLRVEIDELRRQKHTSPALTNRAGTFASSTTLEILRRATTVWDYSKANLAPLAALGIQATHVPLGSSAPWRARPVLAKALAATEPSIDILFYGTLTSYRAETLDMLRSAPAPLRVFHANAESTGIFGHALDALLLDAKIVLNLRAFGDSSEWKMPRLARLLSNERFVISEGRCEETGQCARFKDGVVFVHKDELKAAITYFLARPEERRKIARRGFSEFGARPHAASLRAPVERLLQDCVLVPS